MVWLGDIALSRRDLGLAESYARQAQTINAGHPASHALLALVHEGRNDPARAEEELRAAIRLAPSYIPPYLLLVRHYLRASRVDEAIAQGVAALKVAPNRPGIRETLLVAYIQAGRSPEAITEAHALIKQRPKDPALHNTLGALYGRSGDPSRAAREFHEALRLDPKFSPAYLNLGDSYLVRNDRARALQSYLEAGRLTPMLAEAHRRAGDLYLADKRIDEALAAYTRALIADPKAVGALTNLARIYTEERRDLKQAVELAQRAESLAPRDWYVQDVLGWSLYESGKIDEAVPRLEEAKRLEPQAARARYHLGMAYLGRGMKSQAASELRAALSLAPNLPQRDAVEKTLADLPP
jgi:tetratricopeptide (TPR) repeat protein